MIIWFYMFMSHTHAACDRVRDPIHINLSPLLTFSLELNDLPTKKVSASGNKFVAF